ncbi:MAG: Uma2 family endonuclease [Isosphaeraceae bacterium]
MPAISSMPPMALPAVPIRIPSPLYRMTLEKYESLIASGVFNKRDRVHLINGFLVTRMAESPLQSAVCEAIRLAIGAILLATWHPRSDKPLRIPAQSSMPEPDLAIVRGDWRTYANRYPEPADTALVVEVSLSSLDEDRALADIYGASDVPVYWIVNLVDGQVEVYTDPGPAGYRSHEVLAPGHTLRVVLDGVEVGEIAVADILP